MKFAEYAKAYIALAGLIATALLGVYGGDTEIGQLCTIVVAIASAFATWRVPNKEVPEARHRA